MVVLLMFSGYRGDLELQGASIPPWLLLLLLSRCWGKSLCLFLLPP